MLSWVSCLLSIAQTILVGRKHWTGWVLGIANGVLISYIGLHTKQAGFVGANVACTAVYVRNLWSWRS